jgi:hypothetical protein
MADRKSLQWVSDDLQYYPHQIDGVRWMAARSSFILADDMGLGKTLQALTTFAVDVEQGYAKRMLAVVPVTLKDNWREEVENFTTFIATVVNGTAKKRSQQIAEFAADPDTHILIVNYEQVKPHLDELNAIGFDVVVYDEAHMMKNPKAARTKAAQGIVAGRHFCLTGSPMLNQVNELWSLLHRVDPIRYPKYWSFVNRYCNTPEAPVWMADGTFKPIGDIKAGDEVMGWEDGPSGRRHLCASIVEEVQRREAPEVIRATFDNGESVRCTPDHVWLSGNHNAEHVWTRIKGNNAERKGTLSKVVTVPGDPTPEQQRAADWLSGIYDGEASRYFIAQCPNHNPAVYHKIADALEILEIPHTKRSTGISINGGRDSFVKLLCWGSIERDDWLVDACHSQLNRKKAKVVSVESEGPGEVVAMQTSTGNYVAWGYASKNCVFGGYKDKQIVGVKNEDELIEALQDVMLRRTKDEVLDLPPKQIIKVACDLTPKQRTMYEMMREEGRLHEESEDDPVENALTKYLRYKQISGTTLAFNGENESGKLDVAIPKAIELLKQGHRIVVFTQFRDMQKAFALRLAAAAKAEGMDIPYYELHGDVPKPDRQGIVHKWAKNSTPGVICCMLQVAGIGLNMTAARHGFFLDKLYVPKLNEQAQDRMHRIGADETQPVQIFEFIARRTVEQRIENILTTKSTLFGTVVDTSDFKRKLVAALEEDD